MKHIELTDLHINDWVQIKMSDGNFSPPVKVVAIFADGFVHTNTSDEQDDSLRNRIEDIYDIELTQQTLGMFKFEIYEDGFGAKTYMTSQSKRFCEEKYGGYHGQEKMVCTFRQAIQDFKEFYHIDPQLEVK